MFLLHRINLKSVRHFLFISSITVVQPVDCNQVTHKVTVDRAAYILHTREVSGSSRNFAKGLVAQINGMLPGDMLCCIYRLCCLCRGYVSKRKAMFPREKLCFHQFVCVFLPQLPQGTCCDTISNLSAIAYLHVPSISLFFDNRTVWYQGNARALQAASLNVQ